MRAKTDLIVMIEGNAVPVEELESGRLVATVHEPDGNGFREWHAMTMDILQQRIARTTE
jgi:hypothetical protein